MLIQLEHSGLRKRRGDEQDLVTEDDPVLVVHPNYVVE